MPDNQTFIENESASALAPAIVDTVREPLLVLDKDLRVLTASRSFYLKFKVSRECAGRPARSRGCESLTMKV
jgi:chemotaxis protein methyltransferase CheR